MVGIARQSLTLRLAESGDTMSIVQNLRSCEDFQE